MRAAILAALIVLPVSAAADPPKSCAESFGERLADAKRALAELGLLEAEAAKHAPTVAWFEAHCRFLTDLERVERHVDDEAAFVCDPKAKGRPASLTADVVLRYATLPSVGSYQAHHGENGRCYDDDKAARTPLLFGELTALQRLEVLCYGDESVRCVKARASIAAARAKGKR